MAQVHKSWPVCGDCQGYGVRLVDAITGRRDTNPCGTCNGAGRAKPEGWKDPVWEPAAVDGSHDGWLVDPGSDPDLKDMPRKPASGAMPPTRDLIQPDLPEGEHA